MTTDTMMTKKKDMLGTVDEEAANNILPSEDHQGKNREDKKNELLRMVVLGLGVTSLILVGCIIVLATSSIHATTTTAVDVLGSTAATEIDVHTGIAYAAGIEHPVLKTEDVIFYSDNMDIAAMTNDELKVLKEILLDDENIKFVVKGFGRDAVNYHEDVVHVIVEGGTLTWDSSGIVDASGDAIDMILDSAFSQDQEEEPHDSTKVEGEDEEYGIGGGHRGRRQRGRRLPSSCTYGGSTGSGSSNRSRSF